MSELFLSGYCRAIDGARTVTVEDGCADCDFPACVYAVSCPIAAQIREEIPQTVGEKGKN